MAYTANGTIVLTPQRAILDASQATVNLTLAAPGRDLVGKIIAAVAVDVSNNAQVTFPSAENSQEVHAFTEAGQAVWFYGATESVWTKFSDVPGSVPLGTYGDGSSGDETFGASDEITVNQYWENLTLNASVELTAKSVIAFVKDTLTMNAGAYFTASGNAGAAGSAGGAGGAGAPARWFGPSGGGGAGGNNGSGVAGTSADPTLGGVGGAGGASKYSGGAGDNGMAPTYFPRFLEAILHGQDRDASGYEGGAGGGGGGSAAGTQAPGGGGGGGVVVIVAKHLILNTSGTTLFRSRGGSGGDASVGFEAGGGGGGGGGFVCLVYQTAKDHNGNFLNTSDLEALIDVGGGEGGAGQEGDPGGNGTSGNKIVFRHG